MQTSKMSLYEALCDTPGDCPKYFNPNYVIGITVSAVYAVLVGEEEGERRWQSLLSS